MEFENAARDGHHQRARSLVHIRLNVEWARGSEILLCVPGVAITCISSQPPIEVISIAQEKAPVSVACWLIPFPLESFVKNPVPWALISCQCPSWAIAPEAVTRIPRIAATTSFRIMFFFLPCWISLPNDKTNSTKQTLADNPLSRRNRVVTNSIQ